MLMKVKELRKVKINDLSKGEGKGAGKGEGAGEDEGAGEGDRAGKVVKSL
jgi:hypothetical protein